MLVGYMGQKDNRNNLPSWVPDWSALVYDEEVRRSKVAIHLYDACKGSKLTCWTSPEAFWISACKDILSMARHSKQKSLGRKLTKYLWSLDLIDFGPPVSHWGDFQENIFEPNWSGWWRDFDERHPCAPQPAGLHTPAIYSGTVKILSNQFPNLVYETIRSSSYVEWRRRFMPADCLHLTSSFGHAPWNSRWESQIPQAFPEEINTEVLRTLVFDLKYVFGQFERLDDSDEVHLRRWWATKISPVSQDYDDILGFDYVLSLMASKRRLFMTQGGRFGWGPDDLASGDHIFILPGGKTPYILRAADGQIDSKVLSAAQLIGSCYLQGAMDGQQAGVLPFCSRETQVINEDYVDQLRNMVLHFHPSRVQVVKAAAFNGR
ncbi:hypothetical protein F4821DRAFT_257719 [Hypoxylon rubiginosum]|uniref:Uncharacterized protein n=1 Tax=Hypoxylon rubiginosum TaxID=110542 RepID=A0ACC0D7N3_9PEZI|nr:hypothetical protein F4821DRAFT_257719 [Hypoxylon rubiginosum]